jgi:hypothetical protein
MWARTGRDLVTGTIWDGVEAWTRIGRWISRAGLARASIQRAYRIRVKVVAWHLQTGERGQIRKSYEFASASSDSQRESSECRAAEQATSD